MSIGEDISQVDPMEGAHLLEGKIAPLQQADHTLARDTVPRSEDVLALVLMPRDPGNIRASGGLEVAAQRVSDHIRIRPTFTLSSVV